MMKIIRLILAFALFSLICPPFVDADFINISAFQDAGTECDTPGANHGTVSGWATKDITQRGYRPWYGFRFNTTIAGATITSATLFTYAESIGATWSDSVFFSNGTWTESDLTANSAPCATPIADSTTCNATAVATQNVAAVGGYLWNVTAPLKQAAAQSYQNVSLFLRAPTDSGTCQNGGPGAQDHGWVMREHTTADQRPWLLIEYTTPSAPDTTPPSITGYSSQGSSCTNWNTNPANPCSTPDTTPTLYFNTSENAFCAIGRTNVNYTDMGSSRNCTSGEGTTEHACTLTGQDELVYEDSNVSLSCKDASGNENRTSTSGGLSLTVTGMEVAGDTSIGVGGQNALLSGYTNYTSQQVYARHFNGAQDVGTFDWLVKKGSKAWAFNYVTKGEQHVGMFNITPSLYVLEINNVTSANITKYVELLINATR